MQLQYIFIGTPAKYAAVMWHIASKLGERLRVRPSSFCSFIRPRVPSVLEGEDPTVAVSPNVVEVVTEFSAERYWEKLSIPYGEQVWNAFMADEPLPEKPKPESPDDNPSVTFEELTANWTEDDWMDVWPGSIEAQIKVEDMQDDESLLSVEADDRYWPKLQSSWQLIMDELYHLRRLRDVAGLGIVAPPPTPMDSDLLRLDGLSGTEAARKQLVKIHELRKVGKTIEQISAFLNQDGDGAYSVATVNRALKKLKSLGFQY
jgi:hypothetical protein